MRIAAFAVCALFLLCCTINAERGVKPERLWEAGIFASLLGVLALAVTT